MKSYDLVCSGGNDKMIRDVLKASGITVSSASSYILCEEGMPLPANYDLLICFKKDKLADLLALLKSAQPKETPNITGAGEGEYVIIKPETVVYFNASGNDTYANLTDGSSYKVRHKLYELEESLPRCFIRINKSEIVNIKYVLKIIPMFKGKLILKLQGYKAPVDISRNYTKAFKERIGM